MPKPNKTQNRSPSHSSRVVQTATTAAVQFQGPLPHPQLLEGYEKIVPGSAERILKMAEEQQTHRHGMERQALQVESRNSFAGIICAFVIGIVTVVCGSLVAYSGVQWQGYAISGTGLVSLVGTFIYGTRARRKEREEKFRAMRST
jgi:uncharacterized membrane protein